MKAFDLERALAGDPVVTREGRKVRIIPTLLRDKHWPVVGYIDCGDEEMLERFTTEGKLDEFEDGKRDSRLDLFMAPLKHEGWINIYHSEARLPIVAYSGNAIYSTEEKAKEHANPNVGATVKIEWEA